MFGFTGEPTDANNLLYLRNRHYNPLLGVFMALDPLEGRMGSAMSLNRYGYVQGNVNNAVDPSGLRSISPNPYRYNNCHDTSFSAFTAQPAVPSQCEKFADEVGGLVYAAEAQGIDRDYTVAMLYAWYAGGILTFDVGFLKNLVIPAGSPALLAVMPFTGGPPVDSSFRRDVQDRYLLGDSAVYQVFDKDPNVQKKAEAAAISYGFRRQFYNNTHHYIADLYMAWFYGGSIATAVNDIREVITFKQEHGNQNPSDPNYREGYIDSLADILVSDTAVEHVGVMKKQYMFELLHNPGGSPVQLPETSNVLKMLPALIRQDVCGQSVQDIYSQWEINDPRIKGLFDTFGIQPPR